MNTGHVLHELPFIAPVPRNHEVLVATLRRSPHSDTRASLVLDRTTGILYCSDALWGPLDRSPLALTDPIGVLTRFTWTVVQTSEGRCMGAMISTSSHGDSNHAHTRLYVEGPSATAYR
jgi:hypothetical protein